MWLSQHLEPETSNPIPSWININYPPAKNVLSIVICQCPHAPACPLCLSVFSSATAAPSSFLVLLSKPYGGWVASANPGYCFGWRCSYLPAQESVTMPQKEHTTRKVTPVWSSRAGSEERLVPAAEWFCWVTSANPTQTPPDRQWELLPLVPTAFTGLLPALQGLIKFFRLLLWLSLKWLQIAVKSEFSSPASTFEHFHAHKLCIGKDFWHCKANDGCHDKSDHSLKPPMKTTGNCWALSVSQSESLLYLPLWLEFFFFYFKWSWVKLPNSQ